MANMRQHKIKMRSDILRAVMEKGNLDRQKLVASICLETGFTDKVIDKILQDMAVLDQIELSDLVVGPKRIQPGGEIEQ